MTTIECVVDLVGHGPDLDAYVTAVMDELCELEGAIDPDVSAALVTGEVTVSVSVAADGDRGVDAAADALNMVRSALHAAGGTTAEFEWILRDLRATREGDGELVA